MAMFVHLTPEKRVKLLLKNGINRLRKPVSGPKGVFAMPVMRNFYVSHQWLRELKRRGDGSVAGVYFRIPDEQTVWVGHYNDRHKKMTACEATAMIQNARSPEGFEVVIPRRIDAQEIQRVRILPQVLGWRYFPGSHKKKPCGCEYCQRGQYGAKRLRAKYEAE